MKGRAIRAVIAFNMPPPSRYKIGFVGLSLSVGGANKHCPPVPASFNLDNFILPLLFEINSEPILKEENEYPLKSPNIK